jgi:hypothetical protein
MKTAHRAEIIKYNERNFARSNSLGLSLRMYPRAPIPSCDQPNYADIRKILQYLHHLEDFESEEARIAEIGEASGN